MLNAEIPIFKIKTITSNNVNLLNPRNVQIAKYSITKTEDIIPKLKQIFFFILYRTKEAINKIEQTNAIIPIESIFCELLKIDFQVSYKLKIPTNKIDNSLHSPFTLK